MSLSQTDLKAIKTVFKEALAESKGRFEEKCMNTKTASQIYGIPIRKLNNLCLLGKIKATKPDGSNKWLIKLHDIQKYIDGYPADTEQERKRQEKEEKRKKRLHLT